MKRRIGRYSKYLRPITILIDISVLNILQIFFFSDISFLSHVLITCTWLACAYVTSFYEVFRFTKIIQITDKIIKQFALFVILIFAYIGFSQKDVSKIDTFYFVLGSAALIVFFKLFIYKALKVFRAYYNGNQRRVIVIGKDVLSNQLVDFFTHKKDYGYVLVEHFKDFNSIETIAAFCESEYIEEIYISLENTSSKTLKEIIDFTDDNFLNLKYIPTKTDLISNLSKIQYYDLIPVIPSRKFPLQLPMNQFIKRVFDIVVSSLVIIFVLSWLIPLIGLFIKLESKGPIFFNQRRNGLYYKEFNCFKFRSMYVNNQTDSLQATKNDKRITKVGKFLRKSSLDEMPQFLNVFLGDMSVCGPRPHPVSMTHEYQKRVNKFKLRHYIKPGITGMAQTHGFRGEIECERDIINRVKYDIFYLENWSLLLDIKIVYLTIKNAILGDEKAY